MTKTETILVLALIAAAVALTLGADHIGQLVADRITQTAGGLTSN